MLTLAQLEREASACTRCPLASGRTTVVFGVGDPTADLMFVGEGPGRDEDLQGEPFVGRSGQLLDRLLHEELGIGRDRVYIANVVKCRPPGNRDPHPGEVASCRPYLESQIELIDPRVVVTLGNFATRLLLDTTEGIKTLRGRAYPYPPRRSTMVDGAGRGWGPRLGEEAGVGAPAGEKTSTVVVPTFHPSFVLRTGAMGEAMAGMRADLVRAKEHLAVRA